MSKFSDEIKALRNLLAEHGIEVTLEKLLDVLEANLDTHEERGCFDCQTAGIGICFKCLKELVQEE